MNYYIILLLISMGCSSLSSGNRFKLLNRSDDYIFFYNNLKKSEIQPSNRISQEKLSNFFRNIFYYKSNPLISEKNYIFDISRSDKIASILFDLQDSADSLLLISKREDPIAPFSRIYRTSLIISFPQNSIKIEFVEIDKYYIFGNQYSFADWSFIPEEAECNYKNNLYINFSIKYVLTKVSTVCTNNLFHDFIIYPNNFDYSSKIKYSTSTIQERLKILEELRENKSVSEIEYLKIRENILNDL